MRILGYIWATPVSLIGIILAIVCRPKSLSWSEGALDITVERLFPSFAAAQTWPVILRVARSVW